jgi:hypothetical protein
MAGVKEGMASGIDKREVNGRRTKLLNTAISLRRQPYDLGMTQTLKQQEGASTVCTSTIQWHLHGPGASTNTVPERPDGIFNDCSWCSLQEQGIC